MIRSLAMGGLLLLPALAQACDVCGIYLGIQPRDRTSSVSMLYRGRLLDGRIVQAPSSLGAPKHGGHGVGAIPLTGDDHYQEFYQVMEFRADLWLSDRVALLASLPFVNNYREVNGYIATDIYGMGDPLLLGRYLVANTKCLTEDDRTVHRVMLGGGVKLPLGASDRMYQDAPVAVDLQPGTGTWDLLGSAEYMVRRGRNGASLTMLGRYNGTNSTAYQLGHGLSTTAEAFRRWDLGDQVVFMPSLGLYSELSGMDVEGGKTVQGTGSSTLFAHAGSRVWWRKWMLSATFQQVLATEHGDLMVPNRLRCIAGVTYNLVRD